MLLRRNDAVVYCVDYSDRRGYIIAVLAVDCVDSGLDEEQKNLTHYEFPLPISITSSASTSA